MFELIRFDSITRALFLAIFFYCGLAEMPGSGQVPAQPADPSQPMPALPVVSAPPKARAVNPQNGSPKPQSQKTYPLGANGAVDNKPASAKSITIVADPSLKQVLGALVQEWADGLDDQIQVVVQFAPSQTILDRIPNGAPWDLVISADVAGMQDLTDRGFLQHDGQQTLARNQVIVLGRHPLIPGDDLTWSELIEKEWRRVIIANPETTALGKATLFALKKHDLDGEDRMKEQFSTVANESLLFQETMNRRADAVFVYKTDAANMNLVGFEPYDVPDEDIPPILYEGAITKTARENQYCSDLLAYCLTDKARETWKKFGFQLP